MVRLVPRASGFPLHSTAAAAVTDSKVTAKEVAIKSQLGKNGHGGRISPLERLYQLKDLRSIAN